MSTETESGLPSQAQNAEQGATQVEQHNSTEATSGQQQQEQQAQQDQQAEQQEQKRTPWFQTRIDELTRARHEERRRADEAQQQALRYQQQLAQFQQQGYQPDQQQPHTQGQDVDVRTLAQQEAARMLADQRFTDQCNKAYSDGKSAFPDFDQAVANLQMLGVSRDFLELATSSDAGAKLLHHLGTDLDETARILTLPPVQMARELTKLEFKLAQPAAPKPVSKAPAPISPLGSSASSDVDPTRMSDSEWFAHRQKTRK